MSIWIKINFFKVQVDLLCSSFLTIAVIFFSKRSFFIHFIFCKPSRLNDAF